MTKPNSLHHLALSTADMKAQIEFFTDVLGMELVALYWMHGAEGAWHGFLSLNDTESVALVFVPENKNAKAEMGLTHPGNTLESSSPGTMQHLSLNVDSMQDLLAMRDRIRTKGVVCMGPIYHGFCNSIYFAGPENLSLEIATSDGVKNPLDHNKTWIDPEVVALAGITEEELEKFTNPDNFESQGGQVAQPTYDPSKPHMSFAEGEYEQILQMSDDVFTTVMSEENPPNA